MDDSHPLFSVIIPCCEVAPYVGECLKSVLAQQVNFEALVVVEESTDDTVRVVRETIAGDSRFEVLTGPRSGSPATPRNRALAAARGEYIVFLDGDDTLTPTALSDLSDWIARYPGCDLYPGALQFKGVVYDNFPCCNGDRPLTGPEATCAVSRHTVKPMPAAPMTVYRRGFLQEKSLHFVDGMKHEDEEFSPRVLFLADSVMPTHLLFYLYRHRADSITTACSERNLEALAEAYGSLFRFHAQANPTEEVSRAWARNWLNGFFRAFFFAGGGTVLSGSRRKKALRRLFSNGFAEFDALARFASRPKRIGAKVIRFAVRTGWYLPATLFFSGLYYPIAVRRRK